MTREEAIRDIEECVIPYVGGISLRMAVEALKEQRPHGEWRGSTERRNMNTRICTSCGDRSVVGYFCMWCGADMRTKEGDKN